MQAKYIMSIDQGQQVHAQLFLTSKVNTSEAHKKSYNSTFLKLAGLNMTPTRFGIRYNLLSLKPLSNQESNLQKSARLGLPINVKPPLFGIKTGMPIYNAIVCSPDNRQL